MSEISEKGKQIRIVVESEISIVRKVKFLQEHGLSMRDIVFSHLYDEIREEEREKRQQTHDVCRIDASVSHADSAAYDASRSMKCLAIQQPWATLIAAGIKDVECRQDMRPPCRRFLIAASKSRAASRLQDVLDGELLNLVNGYIKQKLLPPYSAWPTGAIIGYADIAKVTYDPVDSPWAAGWDGIKYVIENAHLLDTPIIGKNKATPFFYNVEGYDEDHLPAAHQFVITNE